MAGPRLDGEVAIVTGSTAGIGAEIARLFGAEGAKVVVTGRDQERGSAVAAASGDAEFVAADLAEAGTPERLVSAAVSRFGCLTILVNNAVTTDVRDGPVTRVADEDWDRILAVDL
ncbi:MAG: SDR family NAD(P)-dependent oxidoreductase, partial [Actinobacteria bacterium]